MFGGFISGVMTVVHILVSVGLILIVLLQSQQSMNLSGLFGGASQSALGSKPQSVLSKVTIFFAVMFFVTTLFFALYRTDDSALAPVDFTPSPGAPAGQEQEAEQPAPEEPAREQEQAPQPVEPQ